MKQKKTNREAVQLTLSLGASLVDNPSQSQESEKEQTMSVISGMKCIELYERLSRGGLLLKTLMDSSQWMMAKHLKKYVLTWKMKGTKYNRILFQLVPRVHGIEEIGSGLLPTVLTQGMKVNDSGSSRHIKECKIIDRLIPTAREAMSRGNVNVDRGKGNIEYWISKMLPTPTKRDYKGTGNVERIRNGAIQKDTLDRYVEPGTSMKLSPDWVEWLMGFPVGWTDLQCDDPVQYDISIEPNIPRVGKGIKNRATRLKQMGNAIVPQVALEIFKAIDEEDKQH